MSFLQCQVHVSRQPLIKPIDKASQVLVFFELFFVIVDAFGDDEAVLGSVDQAAHFGKVHIGGLDFDVGTG